MSGLLWSVSRGSGGFKASYEAVKARESGDSYEVVFCTPIGVHNKGDFDSPDKAVSHAKEVAQEKGFEGVDT
jgi:hypothetical protein